ncbi:MAG: hypothetical protein IJ617_00760, partial [Oscillospiraceae bacterium]|nr:hypothetical protein [Oscillospiraceae bacterium]
MEKYLRRNWLFLLLTVCAVAAAIGICVGRAAVERANRVCDVVLDYKDLEFMAFQSGKPVEHWLGLFRDLGVEKVALYEDSFKTLSYHPEYGVSFARANAIMTEPNWWAVYPPEVEALLRSCEDKFDFLVTVRQPENYRWIQDALDARIDPEQLPYVTFTVDGVGYIWFDGTYARSAEKLEDFSLGLLPERVTLIESFGFQIIPRTTTTENLNTARFARAVLAEFEAFHSPYFLNGGDGVLGFDEPEAAAPLLLDYLGRTGAAVGVTEQMDQSMNVTWPGFDSFVTEQLDGRALRVFNEYGFVQAYWQAYGYPGPEEIVNSLAQAAIERSCRVIYLRMILSSSGEDGNDVYVCDEAAYEALINGLFSRLRDAGLEVGTARALGSYHPPALLRMLIGFGCVGGALLLLDLMLRLKQRWRLVLLVLGAAGVAGAFYLFPNGAKLLLSMGSGMLFPCLAGMSAYRILQARRWRGQISFPRLLGLCAAISLLCVSLALCGALVATSALSETAYMLEMRLYRGVKLMLLAPVAFLAVMFVLIFCFEDWGFREPVLSWGRKMLPKRGTPEWRRELVSGWNGFMSRPVPIRALATAVVGAVLLLFLGAAGAYFMLRSGNNSGAD